MRRQKTTVPLNGSKKFRLMPKIASFLAALTVIFGIFFSLLGLFKNLDYFRIKDIIVQGYEGGSFPYLKGRNIFSVDLRLEAGYITMQYPAYKKVVLARVLPNRLFINFVKRLPVAYINLSRLFFVDQEGVLLDAEDAPQDLALPVISGLQKKITHPVAGARYNLKELSLALEIIAKISHNLALKNLRIKEIKVSDVQHASFVVLDALEVKIGQEDIRGKLVLLANLLRQARNELAGIEYIDLRFKEPVIKFKAEEKKGKR